jgi:hypothetical protein
MAEMGQVNCKAITFTVEALAEVEGGRVKATCLQNKLKNGVPYTMNIVQDKEDRQSERTYLSVTRWREDFSVQSSGTLLSTSPRRSLISDRYNLQATS